MTKQQQALTENEEKILTNLLFQKIKSLSNSERRTKVIAILKGSDGNYYYGENDDSCLCKIGLTRQLEFLKDYGYDPSKVALNVKDMVVHAEMVALLKMPPEVKVVECATTFDPCLQCLKHLVHRGCQKFYTLKRASKDWNSPERELFIEVYIPGGLY